MEDELFRELELFENKINTNSKVQNTDCKHDSVCEDKGFMICIDCGEEINTSLSYDKDWRQFSPNKNSKIRCVKKKEGTTIASNIDHLNLPENIINQANLIYQNINQNNKFKKRFRLAIIFACVYQAFKNLGMPQSIDKLQKIFQINKKSISSGLKHVGIELKKRNNCNTVYITAESLLPEILANFNFAEKHIQDTVNIFNSINNCSSLLNRSRPKSVACGIIYYYFCSEQKNILLTSFSVKVGLSALTIKKIAREIDSILKTSFIEK
jgi:transcription initiation factor TFIIIB Brf1 subunit/transcription initiation factor TFIIB